MAMVVLPANNFLNRGFLSFSNLGEMLMMASIVLGSCLSKVAILVAAFIFILTQFFSNLMSFTRQIHDNGHVLTYWPHRQIGFSKNLCNFSLYSVNILTFYHEHHILQFKTLRSAVFF